MLILLLFYICKTLLYEIQHKNKSQNISYMIKQFFVWNHLFILYRVIMMESTKSKQLLLKSHNNCLDLVDSIIITL